MSVGTYSIDVCCEGGVVSGNPFSSEVYDIDAVVVSSVSSYIAGKTVEFESKSCSLFNCLLIYILQTVV